MASGLEEVCRNLELTEQDADVITFDDEGLEEKLEQIALCLYGRLLMGKKFNAGAIKSVLRNIWKPNRGVEISGIEVPSKLEFNTARFWAKAYDSPAKKQTVAFAQCLAKQLGSFVGCEGATVFEVDRGNTEAEIKEENKLCLAFRKSRDNTKVRQKLTFSRDRSSLMAGGSVEPDANTDKLGASRMVVDGEVEMILVRRRLQSSPTGSNESSMLPLSGSGAT
ncbi:hypothetical protein Cgig2_026377 [Carnegiea gigantea]|uniref:Uncharacterized protein n=1 Tax=Carnegiea gigantea TaxID=171969 RepID=A0A9Q1Q6P5_9CARY|nr:hypothetical protein Cgig2_026377 [Carnegiea gigantea]